MRVPPKPPVGHVIAYEYLWVSQAATREDGAKVYPCAIVMAVQLESDHPITYVLGISHSPPPADRRAIEVPLKLKRHLGLDDDPAWVYTDEVNVFGWPGPDLRPAEHLSARPGAEGTCIIGPLPSDWFEMLKTEVAESHRLRRLRLEKRTE